MALAPIVNYDYINIAHKIKIVGDLSVSRMIELTTGAGDAAVQEQYNGFYLTWTLRETDAEYHIRVDKEEVALSKYRDKLVKEINTKQRNHAKIAAYNSKQVEMAERAILAKLIAKYGISA